MNKLPIYILLITLLTTNLTQAQQKKHTWYEIQQEKVYALKEYKDTEHLKDSLEKKNNEVFTLSVTREPCDICAKWDIALYDKNRNYLAYYVVKFIKKDNEIQSVMKLHTKERK